MIGTLVGIGAAVAIGVSFIPQLVKGYRTKKMEDLSYNMFFLFITGNSLWGAYGLYLGDIILILANIFNASCCTAIVAMKYHYSKKLKP